MVSKEKLSPRRANSSMRCSINRPAVTAASSGANGERPAAMRSAITKSGQAASWGNYSRANVVLPPPFAPAMIRTRLFGALSS